MGRLSEVMTFLNYAARHPSPLPNRVRAVARLAFRQVHKRLVGRSLIVPWEGMQLEVHPNTHSAAGAYYYGRPDYWEFAFLERFLRAGDLVVDVGANVGVYSLFMAKLVGPTGSVLACEPERENLGRLRANVERNGLRQIEVMETAIGDWEGAARFAAGQDTIGSLLEEGGVEVPLTTLDRLLGARSAVFVKVDVEGFEDVVVGGAHASMARGWPLVWQLELFGKGGHPVRRRMSEGLARHGYQFYAYNPRREALEERDESRCTENLFAIAHLDAVNARLGVPQAP